MICNVEFDDFSYGVIVAFAMTACIVVMSGLAVDVAATAAADTLAQSGNSASSGYTTIPHLKCNCFVRSVSGEKLHKVYVGKVAQTVISVKMVGPMPAIAISFVRMFPTPATIALGGVPTCNDMHLDQNRFMELFTQFKILPACGRRSNSSKLLDTSVTLGAL